MQVYFEMKFDDDDNDDDFESEICSGNVKLKQMFLHQGPEGKQGLPGNHGRPGKKVTKTCGSK